MSHRVALLLVVALGLGGCSADADTPAPALTEPTASPTRAEPEPAPPPFDLTRHSTTDPRSPWVVVNKRRPLHPTYTPELDIVEGYLVHPRVVRPLSRLLAAARREGLDLRLMSAHRSSPSSALPLPTPAAARDDGMAQGPT